jgi:hypothetical protein
MNKFAGAAWVHRSALLSRIGILMLGLCVAVLIRTAWAQVVLNPDIRAAVCAYNSSPPTATSGTFILVQCNSSGQLKLH